MIQRTGKNWMWIAVGMVTFACLVFLILALLEKLSGLARVDVPGSNLTLVLFEDGKHRYRYNVLADGRKVAHDVLLGSRGALTAQPQVSILGDRVTITFRTAENDAPFVEFDLARCRILRHSAESTPPPAIRNCRRK